MAWDERLPTLFEEPFIHDFAAYINRIFCIRFPKNKAKAKDLTAKKTATGPRTLDM